jgi:hypothetical protein
MVFELHTEWSPVGAARFDELVREGFFDGPIYFFRVVPQFVAQFGIHGDPDVWILFFMKWLWICTTLWPPCSLALVDEYVWLHVPA